MQDAKTREFITTIRALEELKKGLESASVTVEKFERNKVVWELAQIEFRFTQGISTDTDEEKTPIMSALMHTMGVDVSLSNEIYQTYKVICGIDVFDGKLWGVRFTILIPEKLVTRLVNLSEIMQDKVSDQSTRNSFSNALTDEKLFRICDVILDTLRDYGLISQERYKVFMQDAQRQLNQESFSMDSKHSLIQFLNNHEKDGDDLGDSKETSLMDSARSLIQFWNNHEKDGDDLGDLEKNSEKNFELKTFQSSI